MKIFLTIHACSLVVWREWNRPKNRAKKIVKIQREQVQCLAFGQHTYNWTYASFKIGFSRTIPSLCGIDHFLAASFTCGLATTQNDLSNSMFFSYRSVPFQEIRRPLAMFVFLICIWLRGSQDSVICIRMKSEGKFHVKKKRKTFTFPNCHSWYCEWERLRMLIVHSAASHCRWIHK